MKKGEKCKKTLNKKRMPKGLRVPKEGIFLLKKPLAMNARKALQMNQLEKKNLNDGMLKRCQKKHYYKSWFFMRFKLINLSF
jgi:hypothetical protein